jgi:hypothetical protein|uniref:Uncharacterized protein n=2 Tax=environmental samples TaxID=371948 RepID=B3TCD1_9ARCH|nr:hypothetical protein ALOHA_HF4000APKG8D22ctg17g5 [uncultured marine crenarchaeote HF4000_APKG8D22]ABZ10246.1 hypothetical protein ALOHA_HF4000APKG10I20ctg7g27 [uncultured marine crenarchaeote HF4000_APKG10I20]
MEVSSLGNFASAQKQTTETNSTEGSKSARLASASSEPQGTTTEEAQTSPIPPVHQTAELSGEEGNTVAPESGPGGAVDFLT